MIIAKDSRIPEERLIYATSLCCLCHTAGMYYDQELVWCHLGGSSVHSRRCQLQKRGLSGLPVALASNPTITVMVDRQFSHFRANSERRSAF